MQMFAKHPRRRVAYLHVDADGRERVKLGRWPTPMTRVPHEKGIVGLGRIGRQIARIATAFEMKVLAWAGD